MEPSKDVHGCIKYKPEFLLGIQKVIAMDLKPCAWQVGMSNDYLSMHRYVLRSSFLSWLASRWSSERYTPNLRMKAYDRLKSYDDFKGDIPEESTSVWLAQKFWKRTNKSQKRTPRPSLSNKFNWEKHWCHSKHFWGCCLLLSVVGRNKPCISSEKTWISNHRRDLASWQYPPSCNQPDPRKLTRNSLENSGTTFL